MILKTLIGDTENWVFLAASPEELQIKHPLGIYYWKNNLRNQKATGYLDDDK